MQTDLPSLNSITFVLEPKDMRAFIAFNRSYNPANRRLRYAMLLILAILSFQYSMRQQETERRIIYFIIVLAFYIAVVWVVTRLLERLRQWRSFTPKAQPGVFCKHTITLTGEALVEFTPVNEAKNLWAGIHSVIENSQYIFIFVAANAAHIIPKRAFQDADTASSFYRRVSRLWSDAKMLPAKLA